MKRLEPREAIDEMKARKRSEPTRRILILAALALGLAGATGCSSDQTLKAFKGKLDAREGEKVMIEYCQSCHSHKDFTPLIHQEEARVGYFEEPFLSAQTCNVCHFVKEDFWRDFKRTTILPDGQTLGR